MQEQLISSTSSSEDENDDHQLTINEHYAKAFQYRKEREELAKRARPQCFSSNVSGLSDFFFSILSSACRVQSRRNMALMPIRKISARTNPTRSPTRARTKMVKSSPPHSTLPSYARSPESKRGTLASTTPAATYSKVRLFSRALFLFAFSYETLFLSDRGARQVWHATVARAPKEEDQGRQAADAPRTASRCRAR